ncbi:MAG: radical SAM protein [Syntrophotaleaceae bacterium]
MLDAIIISDIGGDSFSVSSAMRLKLNRKVALLQDISHAINKNEKNTFNKKGNDHPNWQSAPKLNGIALFSYLDRHGYKTDIIDSFFDEIEHFKELVKLDPRAIIISTTFITNKSSLIKISKEIRKIAPKSIIIAGGPFVFSSYTLYDLEKDNDYDTTSPKKDYLFLSEESIPDIDLFIIDKTGERALLNTLDAIKNNIPFDKIKNIAFWNKNELVLTERQNYEIPRIKYAWEKLPDRFFKNSVINVQASTGCPYYCEFCNFVKDRSLTYLKPLDELVNELKVLKRRGIRYVRFIDDNFRLGRDDLNQVCKTFITENIGIKWMSFIRASTLAKTDLELLKNAGCVEAQMGIESADKNILKEMNKEAEPELYRKVIQGLLKVGINCSCCFIFGFPGETSETVTKTVNFINTIQEDSHEGIFFWSIYPFLFAPLSPIYTKEKRAKYNLEGYLGKWQHTTMTSEEAQKHIMDAFLNIDNASPIYSGDDLNMLFELSPKNRKEFMKQRHKLSKRFLNKEVDVPSLSKAFSHILSAAPK